MSYIRHKNSNADIKSERTLKKLPKAELKILKQKNRSKLIKKYNLTSKLKKTSLGLTGLKNQGNSCYMNSTFQCLINTPELTNYLFFTNWKEFINPLRGKSKGILVCEYLLLLKKIWMEENSKIDTLRIYLIINKISNFFADKNQHDSHEFLSYFLNVLKDDTNSLMLTEEEKFPIFEINKNINYQNFAEKCWQVYMKNNSSYISHIFHGQFFSKIICSECNYKSISCNSFDMLNLDIPDEKKNFINFSGFFMHFSYQFPIYRFLFEIDKNENFYNIFKFVISKINQNNNILNLEFNHCLACFVKNKKIVEFINHKSNLKAIDLLDKNKGLFFIIRIYEPKISKLIFLKKHFFLENKIKNKLNCNKVNLFFFMSGNYIGIQKIIAVPSNFFISELYFIVYYIIRFNLIQSFFIDKDKLIQNSQQNQNYTNYLKNEFNEFFFNTKNWQEWIFVILINDNEIINLESSYNIFQNVFGNLLDIEIHFNSSKIKQIPKLKYFQDLNLKNNNLQKNNISLYNCLDFFIKEEKLDKDNKWLCPKCKLHINAILQTKIQKSPEILIIHLKRFKTFFKNNTLKIEKHQEFINFPLQNFNLEKYLVYYKGNFIYKLYAVINHYGNFQKGHYTAICQNHVNMKWYFYNDDKISEIKEEDIISEFAYVLFYRKVY